jgi:3-dehydroquinate dehydratase/shikimate dehydrogenase
MVEVVETVKVDSMSALRAARDRVRDADLVELRLDGVRDLDVAGALAGRRAPVVVTCRAAWEGGRFDGTEEERLRILGEAIRQGAEYVDVEWKADRRSLPPARRTAVVLSHHDYTGVPRDLAARVRAMRRESASLVKIAVTARRLADCVTLRDAVGRSRSHVAIAMGSAGWLTRAWPAGFGSRWMYGGAAEPGQITTRDLVRRYRVRETTRESAVYGIVGAPLEHSASPAMHNRAFADLKMNAVYVPLESSDARDVLTTATAIGVRGLSVTAPLKQALYRRLDADAALRAVGALNTLRRRGARWTGANFDVAGFLAPLDRRRIRLADTEAVVLGAGGAARSAAWGLRERGAHVAISARRPAEAARLARSCGVDTTSWPPPTGWDLLVNATPAGTWPDVKRAPIPRRAVRGGVVYDLIYNPADTTLLRWARGSGARAIGGLEMLVHQAAAQFEWWTGRQAPIDTMARAAREFLRERH